MLWRGRPGDEFINLHDELLGKKARNPPSAAGVIKLWMPLYGKEIKPVESGGASPLNIREGGETPGSYSSVAKTENYSLGLFKIRFSFYSVTSTQKIQQKGVGKKLKKIKTGS